jgi:hypothetical protein
MLGIHYYMPMVFQVSHLAEFFGMNIKFFNVLFVLAVILIFAFIAKGIHKRLMRD